jgi:hypothetical protein
MPFVFEAGSKPHSPGRPLEKHIHVFLYLTVFSKLLKEVRPPGFFEKIGNRPGERGFEPASKTNDGWRSLRA